MKLTSARVALATEDLVLLGDEPELLAIADAIQSSQRLPMRPLSGATRTQPRGRQRLAVLVAASSLAVVLTGVAVAGAFGLFDGTPAPPAVKERFAVWNRTAGWVFNPATNMVGPPPTGTLQNVPSVDPSQAHGVLEVQLGYGKAAYRLWAAPLTNGPGQCAMLDHTDAQGNIAGGAGPGPGYRSCVTPDTSSTPLPSGLHGPAVGPNGEPDRHLRVVSGKAPGASSVEVRFADGTSTTAPVVEGFFLMPINGLAGSPSTEPIQLTSYDAEGNEIAQATHPYKGRP